MGSFFFLFSSSSFFVLFRYPYFGEAQSLGGEERNCDNHRSK